MARPIAAPTGEIKRVESGLRVPNMPMKKFIGAQLSKGLVTSFDPADIDDGALLDALNTRIRFDRTSRRYGTSLATPTKPDALKIISFAYFKKRNDNEFFYRFTPTSIYLRGSSAWTQQVAGVSGVLSGSDLNRFSTTVAFDRFFFANGVDPIQEIDTGANTFDVLNTDVGVDTTFRFITSFFNRLVGARLSGDSVMIGWSADAGITGSGLEVWDSATNETAGRTPLVSSPTDLGDPITGIFGLTNIMLIMRENSIWVATKQPIGSDPFNFYSAFPGLGCDCPNSLRVVLNSLAWLDTNSKTVWAYSPGGVPERIGYPVEKDILKALDDKDQVFSSYSPQENEYSILIPLTKSNFTRSFTYSFRTKTWVYDEFEGVSAAADINVSEARISIDELQGTIDDLIGTIDGLAPTSSVPNRIYGRTDGEIIIDDPQKDSDPPVSGSTVTGPGANGEFVTIIESKEFEIPELDVYVGMVRIEYEPTFPGSLTLEYSKDRKDWVTAKTVVFESADIGKTKLLRITKNLKCRRFAWRVKATNGRFDLLEFEVHTYATAPAR